MSHEKLPTSHMSMLAHETLKQADPHPDPQKNQGAYNGLSTKLEVESSEGYPSGACKLACLPDQRSGKLIETGSPAEVGQ